MLVLSEWVELPAIGPDHITTSRFTKHVVTGDLNGPVVVFPQFKGKEKHYLKTQLVRMMFNCEKNIADHILYLSPKCNCLATLVYLQAAFCLLPFNRQEK